MEQSEGKTFELKIKITYKTRGLNKEFRNKLLQTFSSTLLLCWDKTFTGDLYIWDDGGFLSKVSCNSKIYLIKNIFKLNLSVFKKLINKQI